MGISSHDIDGVRRHPSPQFSTGQCNPMPAVTGVDDAYLRATMEAELPGVLRPRAAHDLYSRSGHNAGVVIGVGVHDDHEKQERHHGSRGPYGGHGANYPP